MPDLDTTVKISVPGNHLMTALLGPRDELLRVVERAFPDVAIHVRGNEINVDGSDASTVGQVFEELVMLLQQGHPLEPRTLARTIDMVRADERPSEVLTAQILRTARGASIRPKSSGQKRYVDAIDWVSDDDKRKVYEGNALKIYPRLKNYLGAKTG